MTKNNDFDTTVRIPFETLAQIAELANLTRKLNSCNWLVSWTPPTISAVLAVL
jgi:hypothetical protein